MDDHLFLEELRQIVVRRAAAMHLVDTMAFVSEVAERLEEDPVFGEYFPAEHSGTGLRNRQFKLHGFTELDESDGSIGLVIAKWSDTNTLETLTTATVNQLSGWLETFVEEAIGNSLNTKIAEVSPAYEIATKLQDLGSKISRIRLHIFSNQSLSQKFKEELCGEIKGIPLERHIWDLQRLKALYESSREREAIEIDFKKFGTKGIPCLYAASTESLKSYLCVVDGKLLADLFNRYGSRLLEGNVRSFLGMKGSVNKKIRATIQDCPGLFFAYNNGIAATATNVNVENVAGQSIVTGLTDLQIVNGGQTTASILSAHKKDRLSLDGIAVQMKLTEVDRDNSHDLIPKIAEYANTQNKVALADFFANHPFHRRIAEISERLQIPAKAGVRIQSKWYYERARGQYQNDRLYLSQAKKNEFDLEYPPQQVINKTDLSKYANTWKELPHWISLGAQKNFIKFAGQFSSSNTDLTESEYWNQISPNFGESYYKEIVALAILWKQTENIVSNGRGTWYQGGYRSQIVGYSLSLLFHAVRRTGSEFDLVRVWMGQGIESVVECRIRDIAISVQKELLSPPQGMTNVGEWAKKEACWDRVKKLSVTGIEKISGWCVSADEYKKTKAEGKKQGIRDESIDLQKTVLELTIKGYWNDLLRWPKLVVLVSPDAHTLVRRASTTQGFSKINTEKDWKKLLEISRLCEDEGFRSS